MESTSNTAKFIKPTGGKITSRFGYRTDPKTKEKKQFHNGVDFAVPVGTKIIAPADGFVAGSGTNDMGGLQLFISHPGGYVSGFAHLSKVLVSPGVKVLQGQPVALSGNSGAHTTGPHLHYTLKKNGKHINPLDLLT